MKNLKISVKLMISFGVVVFLTLIMGIASIVSTDRIEKSYTELISRDMASLNDLDLMGSSLYSERSELRAIMLCIFRDDFANAREGIEGYRIARESTNANMDAYRATLRTQEGQGLYNKLNSEYEDYSAAADAFISAAEAFLSAAGAADVDALYALLQHCEDKEDVAIATVDGMTTEHLKTTQASSDALTIHSVVSIRVTIGVLIAVTLISVCLAVYISALITKPLALMRNLLTQVSETGDLTFGEEKMHRIKEEAAFKDEIAQSIAAFAGVMEQFSYYGKCLGAVADRDLTVKVRTLSDRDTCGVALKTMLTQLNTIFGEIVMSAAHVSSGSSQIAQASTNLATGASEQAGTIEELTATVTEVHGMADENTRMATEVLQDVRESGRMMGECTIEMDHMLHAMQDIDKKSQRISNVIKVIDEIAFQTNILALNAAVEAARAGRHGKGFAVVSDEVRSLASKSANAAKETAELIEGSLRSVSEGNTIVTKVHDSLRAVGAISDKNAASMEELHSGSTRQSSSMAEINTAITELSSVVQANSATAEETAASSEEMSSQSVVLNDIVSLFKVDRNAAARPASSVNAGAEQPRMRPESMISLSDDGKY
jgi:methyl-accepting chemotaxis protein